MALDPIEFYFDLSSPYAYLTSLWLDDLAKAYDREVEWMPIMLGVAFKQTGMGPLFQQPLRGEYGKRDYLRSARLLGVQAVVPKDFPYLSLEVSRGFYYLQDQDVAQAKTFVMHAFERYFLDGIAPVGEAEITRLCELVSADTALLLDGIKQDRIKEQLKAQTAKAIDKGVFGAPFVFVDGEPFWGNDRRDQIEQWLKTGGW